MGLRGFSRIISSATAKLGDSVELSFFSVALIERTEATFDSSDVFACVGSRSASLTGHPVLERYGMSRNIR